MRKISFRPIWFDSMGAKSSCTLVRTPDVSILIDPGVAVMQPSFPASIAKKVLWASEAKRAIKKASKVDVVVTSHYHYDHYMPDDLSVYQGKISYAKNPNQYINDSQRERAVRFYQQICKVGGLELKGIMEEPKQKEYPNPLDGLPLAKSKDFGDYQERREQLIEKWRKRFYRRVDKWNGYRVIPDFEFRDFRVIFADSKEFAYGKTKIRFSKPLFHGIEYSRVGWVIATIVTYGREKFIHSSDLNGIYVEDYAKWLVKEDPQVLIADGPATYMLGYMLNKINLNRCIENTCKILKETENLELMIYDHHLLREKRYRKRTKKVWETGDENGVEVKTAAEYLDKTPVIDQCS